MVQLIYNPDNPKLPFFFSLHGPVGKGYGHTRVDDVMLVQYYFVVSREFETGETLAVFRKIKVTGIMDDALVEAIFQMQKDWHKERPNIEVDGIVSVPRTTDKYLPGAPWAIMQMNYNLLFYRERFWPRLDLSPDCPALLGKAIRSALSSTL